MYFATERSNYTGIREYYVANYQLTTTAVNDTTLEAYGDYSGGQVYVGIPYTMRYRFSPQYVKDGNGVSV